ncbi:MAG: DNA repair protein RecO [Deltaproteobacteria bacterium]|nr:DNA repair protein RecO [Deltaproteobacteria bacterium]
MKTGEIISDHAWLIKSTRYGDSHRILTLLTKNHGRVDAIAYGALGSRKRFGGTLDFLNLLQIEIQAGRGDLNRLVKCELVSSDINHLLAQIKLNYQQTVAVLSWFKLISKIIPRGGGQDLDLFSLLANSLQAIAIHPLFLVHLVFLKNLLNRLGYLFDFSRCLNCRGQSHTPFYFELEGGAFYCSLCFKKPSSYSLSDCISDEVWSYSANTLAYQQIPLNELETLLMDSYQHFLGVQFDCFEKIVA